MQAQNKVIYIKNQKNPFLIDKPVLNRFFDQINLL